MNQQLSRIDHNLYRFAKNLFYNRKFDLHSLYAEKKEEDRADLNLLMGLVVEVKEDQTEDNLKDICIKYGINNPLIGDE